MQTTFYIVDDDHSVIKILSNIIKAQNLGTIVGHSNCGQDAIEDIKNTHPDIILLDFLLPDLDGLEIIKAIPTNLTPNIIMISEVTSKEMISKAYRLGIEFFINKPINVVEVVSVIEKVREHLDLKKVLERFEDAFSHLQHARQHSNDSNTTTLRNNIKHIFSKLGILGESGCDDLINGIIWIKERDTETYRLSDLYSAITSNHKDKNQVYAVEQRIRRTITKAFTELVERGLEDYNDYLFEHYASLLFDFSEIRKQMRYSKGDTNVSGKVNIKKFLEGILIEIN